MLSDDYLLEIEYLKEKKDEIDFEVNVIKKYRKEYEIYKNNLNKNSDSLAPVLYLKSILNEELLKNYSTGDFIFYLEESLKDIQKKSHELDIPNYVANDDFDILKQEQKQINKRLSEISEIKERISSLSNKSFVFGEINHEYNELKKINEINSKNNIDYESKDKLLKYYNDLKEIVVSDDIKKSAIDSLNESIQTNFDTVKSMINYKNYKTIFDIGEVQLRLLPDSDQFPFFIDNVGSKSNYMFLHLCLFLGFHKHFLTQKENFVPNFLFIDQPSIPYYYGGKRSSDDKSKLIDAFKLLNTFMENVLVKYNFQIILVEHAPKNYWEDNKLGYFHVVSEFIDGKALIPKEIFEK
ncbi:DUF3732 domain-containing protein [Acinetobacter baumannii]|nr:DUF3732 domain-containing protein [Acinetobacter baumannii]TPU29198.1 DUF3732 domain-containing protein [Acinetobacter baumannii]